MSFGSPLMLRSCLRLDERGDREGYRQRGRTEHLVLLRIVGVEVTVFRVGLGGDGREEKGGK